MLPFLLVFIFAFVSGHAKFNSFPQTAKQLALTVKDGRQSTDWGRRTDLSK